MLFCYIYIYLKHVFLYFIAVLGVRAKLGFYIQNLYCKLCYCLIVMCMLTGNLVTLITELKGVSAWQNDGEYPL